MKLVKQVKRIALVLLCIPALASGAPPGQPTPVSPPAAKAESPDLPSSSNWQQKLSPLDPGTFPPPPPLVAKYHFGWMKVGGGTAEATLTKPRRDLMQLEVSGGSSSFIRKLWKLDATQEETSVVSTLRPLHTKQVEDYSWGRISTEVTYTDKGVTYLRHYGAGTAAPWEKEQQFQYPCVRDLWTALLYVRSQKLDPGDVYNLVVLPANAPYLATIKVLGKEPIHVHAGKYDALKFDIHLQKITPELTLQPHSKFKRGYAWLSDDADRVLLRVEAEVFVGSVWMELQSIEATK